MNNPLDWLWPLVDALEPLAVAHVVESWPAGVHDRLLQLGFLVQAEDAERVLCPECHGHVEEVIASDGPDGVPRFFIPCPEVRRAHVAPEARRQWSVNLAGLADALASTLGLSGRCIELSPNRLWRLGRTTWKGSPRDVILARGLHWDDAQTIRGAVVHGHRPILFVAQTQPPDYLWHGRIPPVLVLWQVATLGDRGIEIDATEVCAAIEVAEAQATRAGVNLVGKNELPLAIRRQIKAEEKTSLTDDAFKQAYRQCGSVRKAAEFLSKQTGTEVSKDRVQRALQRFGGAAAVLNAEDSNSIQRPVASQRRDRTGKKIHQTKPLKEK